MSPRDLFVFHFARYYWANGQYRKALSYLLSDIENAPRYLGHILRYKLRMWGNKLGFFEAIQHEDYVTHKPHTGNWTWNPFPVLRRNREFEKAIKASLAKMEADPRMRRPESPTYREVPLAR